MPSERHGDAVSHCPICDEPMTEDQNLEFWGDVKKVHEECNPERTVGWSA